jgi:hypothetical protein
MVEMGGLKTGAGKATPLRGPEYFVSRPPAPSIIWPIPANFRFINQLGLLIVIAANHSRAYIATTPHAELVKTGS